MQDLSGKTSLEMAEQCYQVELIYKVMQRTHQEIFLDTTRMDLKNESKTFNIDISANNELFKR